MIKKGIRIIVFLFIICNTTLGFIGISSILLTISIYYLGWYVLTKLIDRFISNISSAQNYKLFIGALIMTLFLSEVTLKYIVKSHLTYLEKNKEFFDHSIYKQNNLINFESNTIRIDSKPEFTYEHRYNSLGLRDIEPIFNNKIFTVIGLGDSFTEGVGSPQDSTWLKLLENNLKRLNHSIQTINAGARRSDPISEFILLEKTLLKYKPNVVIVSINSSDIADIIVRGGKERFDNGTVTYSKGPWWEFFYSFSYIFRNLIHSIFDLNYLLLSEKEYETKKSISLEKIKNTVFNDYKKLAKKNNFKLMIILHPTQQELENKNFPLKMLSQQFTQDSSFQTIDLYNEYNLYQKENDCKFSDLYWQTDLHHNSKGYKLWADILSTKFSPSDQ